MMVMGLYSYHNSSSALKKEILDKLVAVKEIKEESVRRYFSMIQGQIKTLSGDIMVVNAMNDFSKSFQEINKEKSVSNPKLKKELENYYFQQFQNEYFKRNGFKKDVKQIFTQLSDETIFLQNKFISNNPNPLGKKELLSRIPGELSYYKAHEKYHPALTKFLNEFEYYDIFLVDINSGHIVYSVFKEIDFATSLISGPFSDTNFGEAFRKARELKTSDDFVIVDYKNYYPSYEAPASFIASPIFDRGQKIGVMIFQMPIGRLNKIMAERSGMGKTGETFLVGSDFLMRSDSYFKKETHSTENSFRYPDKGKVVMESVKKALKNESGAIEERDYLSNKVVVSYGAVKISNEFSWALIAKIDKKEAYQSIHKLELALTVATIVLGCVISLLGFYFSRSITKPVEEVASFLDTEAQFISEISKEIGNSSNELSESSEFQSSAIQKTVTNMTLFTELLLNSHKNLSTGLNLAESGEGSATNGIKVIEKMLMAMNEIQNSNQKLHSILKAIRKIKKETLVIDEIVSETRLLSFNASIEAARAGEHGKGFSYIAEEVVNLAKISGDASLEIKKIINESSKQVEEVVEINNSKVEDGRDISKEADAVFQETMDYLKRILSSVKTINEATRQQESGIAETKNYMSEMEKIIHSNINNSKKLKTQSDNLAINQRSLQSVVKKLKDVLG